MSIYDVLKGRYGISSPILIAEVGNNHFGSLNLAKTLIRLAHKSGADLVKFQAGVKLGSMPVGFYSKCEFTLNEYIELIEFGKLVGTTVFFSIFSDEFQSLDDIQQFRKISAMQSRDMKSGFDDSRTFISFVNKPKENLISCAPMIASEYLGTSMPEIPDGFGYSCHMEGIHSCLTAVQERGAPVVEKHFTLEHGMRYGGYVFRDTIHGATPEEFGRLASILKGRL